MKLFIKQKILLFFIIFLMLTTSYFTLNEYSATFDEKIREILFDIRGEIPTTQKVTIIDIDEKAISEIGQWPFGRDYMAQVLANLTNAGAGIIGIDIIFSEFDRSSPSFMAKKLNIQGEFQDNDELLSAVVSQTPTVLGYYFTHDLSKNSTPKPNTTFLPPQSPHLLNFDHVVTNISPIQESAYSSGFFNAFNDNGGKMTKMPLMLQYKNSIYPSLVFEMINLASNTKEVKIIEDGYAIHGVKLSNIEIPTDKHGFMRVNFRGAKNSFKYLSFLDILKGDFDKQDIDGKFILIGTSITTLSDLRSTVYDLAMPGVEIHANMIDNILKGDFLYEPPFAKAVDVLVILFLTLFLGVLLLFLSSISTLIVVFAVSTVLYVSYYYFLFSQGLILNLFYPFLSIVITTISAFYINYQREQKQKEFIKGKFAKKVSLEVANDLLSHEDNSFQTSQKELTIFFSDIRGFTNLSEKFDSPQALIELLNEYFEPMSQAITNNQGTIDKFIGDAIMAYWNAPCEVDNHADQALKTALSQLEALDKLNIELQKSLDITIDIGIGIHTGVAVVGEMGSKGRSDYTIIGDNVNLASRIEGLTKFFDANLIISEATKTALTEDYHLKYLARVVVKGKSNAIELYEVLSNKEYELFKEVEKEYKEAIACYKNLDFSHSKTLFETIETKHPCQINQIYIQRCDEFLQSQTEHINTDFIMENK